MKEQVKIGLLAVIAVTLVVDTFFMDSSSGGSYVPGSSRQAAVAPTSTNTPVSSSVTPTFDPAAAAKTPKATAPATKMAFGEYKHDFGSIEQDTENTKVFTFTNTGDKPLIIEDAKGSCGCTVPKYPKEPIAPGGTGEIEVVYKPGKQKAQQTKSVTITANTEPKKTVLTISADVQEI